MRSRRTILVRITEICTSIPIYSNSVPTSLSRSTHMNFGEQKKIYLQNVYVLRVTPLGQYRDLLVSAFNWVLKSFSA